MDFSAKGLDNKVGDFYPSYFDYSEKNDNTHVFSQQKKAWKMMDIIFLSLFFHF